MRTALLGSKAIGIAALDCLFAHSELAAAYTIDDRDDTRSCFDAFMERGAVVRHASDLPDVDLVVVAGWYVFLPDDLLARMPFLGIHHSLLPKYRGGSPLVWAMIRGEREVGTSIFQLSHEMDAGMIWARAAILLDGRPYIGDVLDEANAIAIELLAGILDGKRTQIRQDESKATYAAQRQPDDGLIDWSRPAIEVERFVRAQSRPYPGAFTYADGQRVTIWRASAVDVDYAGVPGQVVRWGGPAIVTGDGLLAIEESSQPVRGRLCGS